MLSVNSRRALSMHSSIELVEMANLSLKETELTRHNRSSALSFCHKSFSLRTGEDAEYVGIAALISKSNGIC